MVIFEIVQFVQRLLCLGTVGVECHLHVAIMMNLTETEIVHIVALVHGPVHGLVVVSVLVPEHHQRRADEVEVARNQCYG